MHQITKHLASLKGFDLRAVHKGICSNFDLIVEDAVPPPAPQSRDLGLLVFWEPAPPSPAPMTTGASRLTQYVRPWYAYRDERVELERLLPGISDIGIDRAVRVVALDQKLLGLPAFKWLMRQEGYVAALTSLPKSIAHQRLGIEVSKARLGLLQAVANSLLLYFTQRDLVGYAIYPTRDALAKAAAKAKELRRFLHANNGLSADQRLPYKAYLAADLLESELTKLTETYKAKPKGDPTAVNRDPQAELRFARDVALNLVRALGKCSPTLLVHLCSIVGYQPADTRALERLASEANARPPDTDTSYLGGL